MPGRFHFWRLIDGALSRAARPGPFAFQQRASQAPHSAPPRAVPGLLPQALTAPLPALRPVLPFRPMQPRDVGAAAACVPDAPASRHLASRQDHGSEARPQPVPAAPAWCARCAGAAVETTESSDQRAVLRTVEEAALPRAAEATSARGRAGAPAHTQSADRRRARRAQSVHCARSPRRATGRPCCRRRAAHIALRDAQAGSAAAIPMRGRPSALRLAANPLAPFAAAARRSRGAARHKPAPAPTSQRRAHSTPHRVRSCDSRHSPLSCYGTSLGGSDAEIRARRSQRRHKGRPFHGFPAISGRRCGSQHRARSRRDRPTSAPSESRTRRYASSTAFLA
jgi:hypothetical protein